MGYDQTIFLQQDFCQPLPGVPTTNMNYSQPTGQYLQNQSIDLWLAFPRDWHFDMAKYIASDFFPVSETILYQPSINN